MIMKTRTHTGTTSPAEQPYELRHRAVARRAAAESIVLLKNEDGLLPLPVMTPLALYGAGAGCTIKGGTGSGDVNERYSVSIVEGLKNAGYPITTEDWITAYAGQYRKARDIWRDEIWAAWDAAADDLVNRFVLYSERPFRMPLGGGSIVKTQAEVALYVLSRVAGEGADRFAAQGDYYLSAAEEQQISQICTLYTEVVLVLNTGGQVDLSVLDKYPNISAVLQISQLGCEGGNAFADVLSGKVTPSGKLTATWAMRYEDYPNSEAFSHNNGNVEQERYHEGIYVGYRYFDTFQVPVRYGFGFGLSYTDFSITPVSLTVQACKPGKPELCLSVMVQNIGRIYVGRETVQVYVSCPQGKLEKEYRRLVSFGKTKSLAPGESQRLELDFPVYALASYDEQTPGWLLERGLYGIFVGNSLENATLAGSLMLEEDKLLVKTKNICPIQEELDELKAPNRQMKALRAASLSQADQLPQVRLSGSDFTTETVSYEDEYRQVSEKVQAFVDTLSVEQLIQLVTGDCCNAALSEQSASLSAQGQGSNLGSSGISVPGSAAQTTSCARKQGLADIVMADGPAGLRLQKNYAVKDGKIVPAPFEQSIEGGFLSRAATPQGEETYYQYCTAFPVGTALAQSWNPNLLAEVGRAVAEEMQRYLITSWLAPGMNIQRNPLCGRNFEYFSEDPLLAGTAAAAITNGVQSEPGCGTTVKHFACNNQEDNRMGSNSILSERALREIYLKGFEIAVKTAQPMFIMTSYNLVNGVHAANNYDLCTAVARDEWGFRGAIMTDWTTTEQGPDCTASGCMRAGNDIVMPGVLADHENLRRELAAGMLSLEELKLAACHLVDVIWRSNMYETTKASNVTSL
ncbi:MAG: glycoside hydrolase family 3 C-terminal domain-containing protein [Oscillospiraceae bacterium]|nr:glycoside hydrolase family 3 C-terminal domain-containing protein [Oscillospiraceae bacterium]